MKYSRQLRGCQQVFRGIATNGADLTTTPQLGQLTSQQYKSFPGRLKAKVSKISKLTTIHCEQ
jgi:hypothetical protein